MAVLAPRKFVTKKGRTITFRSVNASEAAALNQFLQQCSLESKNTYNVPGLVRFTDAEWTARLQKDADYPLNLFIGAYDQDRLIGDLSFYQSFNHLWAKHIGGFGMMILQDYWGEGIGKELLRLMEEHAKALGFTRIEAMVRAFNESGIALYKNAGYKVEGTRRHGAFIDGKYHDEFHIGKLLNEKYPRWIPPTLTTERLILRAVTLDDAPAIFAYASNPKVAEWSLWDAHKSIQDSIGMIKDYVLPSYDQMAPEPFAIALRSDPSTMIGTAGARWESKKSQCMELAAALAEEHWGKGIMTEAQNEVIRYCFEEYSKEVSPVNRIQGHCKIENLRSSSMILKTGRIYEGLHRQRVFNKGKLCDMKVFAILKEDWLHNRKP